MQDKLGLEGQTDKQTNIVTSWAPVRAKKELLNVLFHIHKIHFRKVNEKMREKGMDQRCTPTRVVVNRNWEDYRNFHKWGGPQYGEEVVLTLNEEDLKGIGIKLGDRKIILKETNKLNKSKKISSFLTLGRWMSSSRYFKFKLMSCIKFLF